jgi:hypothetical protein
MPTNRLLNGMFWNARAEVARLEREYCSNVHYRPVSDIPDGLLAEYRDGTETRAMGGALWDAAARGRARDWRRCIPAFQEANLLEHGDWDIPYIWFARFLEDRGRPALAVVLLRNAATYCRRKSGLLDAAGDISLFNYEPRRALHLLAQSVAAKPEAPRLEDTGRAYLFCRLAAVFEALDDWSGASWAAGAQDFSYIEGALKVRIRDAIARADVAERERMRNEAPAISEALQRLVGA